MIAISRNPTLKGKNSTLARGGGADTLASSLMESRIYPHNSRSYKLRTQSYCLPSKETNIQTTNYNFTGEMFR